MENNVLRISLPFKDTEVMILLTEYLHLYETFQRLKGLACINVDLLYLSVDVGRVSESKEEVDKVQELVHTLMNGRKVCHIEISNLKEEVETEGDVDLVKQESMWGGGDDEMQVCQNEISNLKEEVESGDDVDLDLVKQESMSEGEGDDGMQEVQNGCNTRNYWDDFEEYEIEQPTTSEKLLGHDEELVCDVPEEQEGVSTSIKFGKAPLANNTLPASDSPYYSFFSARVVSYDKTLKNRMEVQHYLDSPESHGTLGTRVCKFCDRRYLSEAILKTHLTRHLEDKSFDCTQCGKKFSCKSSLIQHSCKPSLCRGKNLKTHLTKHLENKSFDCTQCGKKFSCKISLTQHSCKPSLCRGKNLKRSVMSKSEVCKTCGGIFKNKRCLSKHLTRHNESGTKCQPKKKFVCDICGTVFVTNNAYKSHKKKVHTNDLQPCPICRLMITRDNLSKHIRYHSGVKPYKYKYKYKCSFCDEAFAQTNDRDTHQRHHHPDQYPHSCSYCNMAFSTKKAVRQHETYHTRKQQFSCSGCTKILFMSEISAKAHTAKCGESHKCTLVLPSSTKPTAKKRLRKYKCPHCNKMFGNNINFVSHIFTSHQKELDRCLLCNDDVTFASSLDLESHMKTDHVNEKLFKCPICGESFYMFRDFYSHKTLHPLIDKKTNICEDCGQAYSRKLGLTNHRVLKHGYEPPKPCQCDICGKKFADTSNLARHKNTHSAIRPYKCSVCGSAFAVKSLFTTHLWTHSDVKKFQCGVCDRGFNDVRVYKSHMKKSHPDIL